MVFAITEAADLPVDRYELPNLLALYFVAHGLLAPGVSATTRPDAQAKGLGEYLRSRLVPGPLDLYRLAVLLIKAERNLGHSFRVDARLRNFRLILIGRLRR